MPRASLIEFFSEYSRQKNETAIAFFRGYRIERWTYGRIADESSQFARELESRGVGPGDKVLLWSENSPQWLVAFWGCMLRGTVVVPIDKISTAEFASRVAQQVNAKLLVFSRDVPASGVAVPSLATQSLSQTIGRHSSAGLAASFSQRRPRNRLHVRNHRRASRRCDFTRKCPRKHRASGK
jgi:long-chain acyl-CoA synthetase